MTNHQHRDTILVICRAALYIIAHLNKRYDLRLRVAAVDLLEQP